MYLTSVKVVLENPGLPLGLTSIPLGCKRKIIQTLMIIFSPVTILLLRMQYQLVVKKRERLQEKQNPYLFGEFCRLRYHPYLYKTPSSDFGQQFMLPWQIIMVNQFTIVIMSTFDLHHIPPNVSSNT